MREGKLFLFVSFFIFGLLGQVYSQLPFVPDSTFGINGITCPITHSGLSSPTSVLWLHEMLGAALQNDGKIVMAGTANFHNSIEVVRLNTDGSLDTTFNHTGFMTYRPDLSTTAWVFADVKVTSTGKILIGYTSESPFNDRSTLLCISPDGSVDFSFGTAGKVDIGMALMGDYTWLYSMTVQSDDKILVNSLGTTSTVGQKYIVTRINTNGAPDSSFGINGVAKCPYFPGEPRNVMQYDMTTRSDGKIVGAGIISDNITDDSMFIIQYKPNGMPDTTFGVNGIVKIPGRYRPYKLRVDTAAYMYSLGSNYNFFNNDTFSIKKFLPDGTPDNTFGSGGDLPVNATMSMWNQHEALDYHGSLELQRDGKMIVAGTSDTTALSSFRVCRLTGNGEFDTTFAPRGVITVHRGSRDYCSALLTQPDGKVVLTGFSRTGEGIFDTALVLAMRFMDGTMAHDTTSATGISLLRADVEQLSVFPNPVTGDAFTLEYSNIAVPENITYALTDIMGRTINAGTLDIRTSHGTHIVRKMAGLSEGVYFFTIRTATGRHSLRVVKQ